MSIVLVRLVNPGILGSLLLTPHLILCCRLLVDMVVELRRHVSVILVCLVGWRNRVELVVVVICLLSG